MSRWGGGGNHNVAPPLSTPIYDPCPFLILKNSSSLLLPFLIPPSSFLPPYSPYLSLPFSYSFLPPPSFVDLHPYPNLSCPFLYEYDPTPFFPQIKLVLYQTTVTENLLKRFRYYKNLFLTSIWTDFRVRLNRLMVLFW